MIFHKKIYFIVFSLQQFRISLPHYSCLFKTFSICVYCTVYSRFEFSFKRSPLLSFSLLCSRGFVHSEKHQKNCFHSDIFPNSHILHSFSNDLQSQHIYSKFLIFFESNLSIRTPCSNKPHKNIQ